MRQSREEAVPVAENRNVKKTARAAQAAPKRKAAGSRSTQNAPARKRQGSRRPANRGGTQIKRRRNFNVRYLTREGVRNVWSNRLMSFASVAVLTSCLLLIGVAFLLFANINVALRQVQNQNIIMVYLEDGASEDDINTVGQDIRMISDVKSAEFVSKDDAYEQQLKSLGENAKLMEGLDENPLPDSYQVNLATLDNYDKVLDELNSIDHVENVRGNSDLANQVRQIRRAVSIVSIGIIVMLLLVSLFIIANTVRVTMYNRRLEISIMKAVGATNWFIRWPFIIEGVVLGIVSGLLAELLVYGLYSLTMRAIGGVFSILGDSYISFGTYGVRMLLSFILVGILAGTIGSIVSMARYLKEQGSVVSDDK